MAAWFSQPAREIGPRFVRVVLGSSLPHAPRRLKHALVVGNYHFRGTVAVPPDVMWASHMDGDPKWEPSDYSLVLTRDKLQLKLRVFWVGGQVPQHLRPPPNSRFVVVDSVSSSVLSRVDDDKAFNWLRAMVIHRRFVSAWMGKQAGFALDDFRFDSPRVHPVRKRLARRTRSFAAGITPQT